MSDVAVRIVVVADQSPKRFRGGRGAEPAERFGGEKPYAGRGIAEQFDEPIRLRRVAQFASQACGLRAELVVGVVEPCRAIET